MSDRADLDDVWTAIYRLEQQAEKLSEQTDRIIGLLEQIVARIQAQTGSQP